MSEQSAYTPPQAAREFGFTEDTIRNAIQSGDLPAWKPIVKGKPRKTLTILHADLIAWIRRGQAAGQSP